MNILFKEINNDIFKIQIDKSQKYFVDSIDECIKRSKKYNLKSLCIYDNDILIGFTMYGFKKKLFNTKQMLIDHFIIDKVFQGNGYGKVAFSKLLDLIKKEADNKIFLSVHRKNYSAIHLYEKYGFKFTGKYNKYLEKIMVLEY